MPDPTAENKQVLMWEREDRGRTSAEFLNRAAETEPKATPFASSQTWIWTMWDGKHDDCPSALSGWTNLCLTPALCTFPENLKRDAAIISASLPPGRFSFARRFETKPPQSSSVPLTAFNFLLNGNFTTEKNRAAFWKAGSVVTPLPHHSEISQFHAADRETALSQQPALCRLLLGGLRRRSLRSHPQFSCCYYFFLYIKFIDLNKKLFTSSIYHIVYIVLSELYSLLCQEALSVLLYWPALDQRLPPLWLIEQREEGKASGRAAVLFLHRVRLVHTFYCTEIIKQPACKLINLFYVGEYRNPAGCVLTLSSRPRYSYAIPFSAAHLLTASVKRVPGLETRCAAERDPEYLTEAERSLPLPRWWLSAHSDVRCDL